MFQVLTLIFHTLGRIRATSLRRGLCHTNPGLSKWLSARFSKTYALPYWESEEGAMSRPAYGGHLDFRVQVGDPSS